MGLIFDKWKKKLEKALEIPPDVLFDLPRITLVGNQQLHIENHKGIFQFSTQTLIFFITEGRMVITGKEMCIQSISMSEVWVIGEIHAIQYQMK
jgi:sporulation protein YqfC